jgi:hypothetical protein
VTEQFIRVLEPTPGRDTYSYLPKMRNGQPYFVGYFGVQLLLPRQTFANY